ncbi:hypothetical protein U5801_28300 [Lamprobacter modestohalophilus]|uniref:hypothetical protein n=1 Tax=Lamprobacter modestohalophilus TaxID=1064514 RepID=UPI002ADEFB0F|nr:hypothetical protein [Lamprobacter modestohalophilus]MEA1053679.1 hypothetical protein [Lamprobacter modestohalophilus]
MNTATAPLLPSPSPLTLEALAEQFAHWRQHKRPGERIPESLWSAAIALAERDGLSRVTRRLRLKRGDLKRHRDLLNRDQHDSEPTATFVELTPAPMTPPPRFAPAALELIRPDGLRLRIELGDGLDAQAVLERFLEAG